MATSLLRVIADLELSLASAVSAGDVVATLLSITDNDGDTIPNGLYGFTIDRTLDTKEYIVCQVTGTSLTSVQSISVQGVTSTGFAQYHRRGATVEVTDWAVLSRVINNLTGATGFDANSPLSYDAAPAGLSGNMFATVNYVLSVVAGGAVSFDQNIVAGVAGENLTKAQAVYLKNDGKWYKASSSATGTCLGVILGICQATVSSSNNASILVGGLDKSQSGLSTGSTYYLQDSAGSIGTSAGTISVDVGVAVSATNLVFSPLGSTNKVLSSVANSRTSLSAANNDVPLAPASGNPELDLTWLPATTATTDQSQTTRDSTIAAGEQNLTTKHYLVAQKFIPTRHSIALVTLYKIADTGSFTGTVKISIQADSAGSPSGADLASYTISSVVWLKLGASAFFTVSFGTEYEGLVAGGSYWIVITPSTTDNSNHPNFGINTAGGYPTGLLKYNNTPDGWTTVATSMLTFTTSDGILGKVPRTSTTTGLLPSAVLPYALVDVYTTPTTVTSTVTETTVYSKQLPGGFFTANSGIKIRVFGKFDGTNVAGTSTQFKVKFNSNILATMSTPSSSNTGWAAFSFVQDFTILNNNSLSAQITVSFPYTFPISAGAGSITAAALAAQFAGPNSGFSTAAIDLSVPGILSVTVTNSNSGDIPTVFQAAIVEKIG